MIGEEIQRSDDTRLLSGLLTYPFFRSVLDRAVRGDVRVFSDEEKQMLSAIAFVWCGVGEKAVKEEGERYLRMDRNLNIYLFTSEIEGENSATDFGLWPHWEGTYVHWLATRMGGFSGARYTEQEGGIVTVGETTVESIGAIEERDFQNFIDLLLEACVLEFARRLSVQEGKP
ncbi:hypothetical protein EON81_03015 [bacterium]|nr:MAG: hypothetical protein EON81_03015 [bacterium]